MKLKIMLVAALTTLFFVQMVNAQSDEYDLPDDKSKPIITMESTGGFRMRPTEPPEPLISIYPDGKVVAGKTNPNVGRAEWKMSREELQELLRFCIKDNKMLEIKSEDIRKAIQDSGQRIMIADAPNTDIMIKTADKENKVSVYALFFAARQFGDKIESVKQVSNVEKKLKLLHATTVVGGPKTIKALIKGANDEIKSKDKEAPEFTSKDLQSAHKTKDGNVSLSFSINNMDDEGRMMLSNFSVQVSIKKGEDPVFTGRAWRKK